MQEDGFVHSQLLCHHVDDILGLREERFSMTYMPFALKAFLFKPPINQIEDLTAVVELQVVKPSRVPLLDDGDVFLAPVPNTC